MVYFIGKIGDAIRVFARVSGLVDYLSADVFYIWIISGIDIDRIPFAMAGQFRGSGDKAVIEARGVISLHRPLIICVKLVY